MNYFIKYFFSISVILFPSFLIAQLPQGLPTNNLEVYYTFNNSANDYFGRCNGVVNGAIPTSGSGGVANTAYSFNGTSSFINIPNEFVGGRTLNSQTFRVKFKVNTVGRFSLWNKDGNWQEMSIYLESDRSIAFFWAFPNYYSSIRTNANTITIGEWHDVFIVVSNNTASIYVDGVLQTTYQTYNITSSAISYSHNGTCGTQYGYNRFGFLKTSCSPTSFLLGSIDEFGLWSRALSSTEIKNIVSGSVTCPFNPFTASIYSRADSLKLDAGVGYQRYLWSTGDTTQQIFAKYTGRYRVSVTNSSGCTAADTVDIKFPDTLGLHVSTVAGFCGKTIDVPVRASTFRHLKNLKGSINWNPADLRFENIAYYGPSELRMSASNFGVGQTLNGRLSFSWNDVSAKGVSLSDTSTIFIMRFAILGNSSKTIPLTFSDIPTALESYDAGNVRKTILPGSGNVNVICEFTISGRVLTPLNHGIKNVSITLTGGASTLTTTTDSSGNYSFKILPGSYILTPTKSYEKFKVNGISTLDIALIHAHTLQLSTLNSPYKVIASDVNRSSGISTADILFLRRLILGTDTTLPNNRIWAFVDGDQNFSNPISPFPFNSTKTLTSQSSDISHTFRGIKIGDVNYDRNPLLDQAPSGDTLHLFGVSSEREDGLVSLKLKSHTVNGLMGWQSTLHWDTRQLQLLDIQGRMANLGIGERWKGDGFVTLSWNDPMAEGLNFTKGADWLEMTFRKTAEFNSTSLILTDQKLNTEAFNGQYQLMGVVMEPVSFRKNSLVGRFRVYPNPVSNHMNVEWKMEEAGKAVIRILDMRGRLLFSESGTYNKGINRLKINRSNVSIGSGNCLVQVEVEGVTSVTSVMMLDDLRIP
jgi:Concanavalin A-like lectin/glucanases superfamily/Carboxypeptidase regulatory-like domain/Secretion system C-terminal sorting domain